VNFCSLTHYAHTSRRVKVRRGGFGTNFCIHRYFFDRSPTWKAIRDEESQADTVGGPTHTPDDELRTAGDCRQEVNVNFTPIDSRHLSSLPLIRGRIIKLLKACKNHTHTAAGLLWDLVCTFQCLICLSFTYSRDSVTPLKRTVECFRVVLESSWKVVS
jgi:hypothetical protein